MILEFYIKHPRLLIITFVLALLGVYQVIVMGVGTALTLSVCHLNENMKAILCYLLGL